jgi:hypothetical protein
MVSIIGGRLDFHALRISTKISFLTSPKLQSRGSRWRSTSGMPSQLAEEPRLDDPKGCGTPITYKAKNLHKLELIEGIQCPDALCHLWDIEKRSMYQCFLEHWKKNSMAMNYSFYLISSQHSSWASRMAGTRCKARRSRKFPGNSWDIWWKAKCQLHAKCQEQFPVPFQVLFSF